jgi:hypothetical protein
MYASTRQLKPGPPQGAFHIGQFQSQAILQVTFIVFLGTAISNLVCFTLWPGSATSKLQ